MRILPSKPLVFYSKWVLGLAALFITACSAEMPLEKAILGTWLQESPVSMSAERLQTTTSDTVLILKKSGAAELSRTLLLQGPGLPDAGISLNVDLRGTWTLKDGNLVQIAESVIITPRTSDALAVQWADQLQKQAEGSGSSTKTIVAADKSRLMLQDVDTGSTDIYRRK